MSAPPAEPPLHEAADDAGPRRPLRIAALVKQVPSTESLTLGPDGRLRREGADHEMNPYCRRAVSKGVELAKASGGACTVFTLGPPDAEDVLREAVAWGADGGVHLCDPAFAGSDTLATARALAAAVGREGRFDLVLVGRRSIDGDTGQVGPELAELLGLPFATGVRRLAFAGDVLRLQSEHDDGWEEVEVTPPALLSVAERLCDPCKVDPAGRLAVPAGRIRRLTAAELGAGPWGDASSPTRVGAVRLMPHDRAAQVLTGDAGAQASAAVRLLHERGALTPGLRPAGDAAGGAAEPAEEVARPLPPGVAVEVGDRPAGASPAVAVLVEPGRPEVAAELLGAARRLAGAVGGEVFALRPVGPVGPAGAGGDHPVLSEHDHSPSTAAHSERDDRPPATAHSEHGDGSLDADLGALGADEVVDFVGELVEEDVALGITGWARARPPWVMLAPSTAFGREIAGRVAAALGAGLVGDAVAVDVVDGRMVAAKSALSGALVADITCTSAVQMATVRPGVLPVPPPRRPEASGTRMSRRLLTPRGRVSVLSRRRDDDVEVLARAEVVIGVGTGVLPEEYAGLAALAAVLGAELAATRKVTDRGWAPRARQVGITGRSIAPRLYVALGLSGKFNHMVGVRGAATVLAINADPGAPVFSHCDVGIIGDWHDVLPALEEALRTHLRTAAGTVGS